MRNVADNWRFLLRFNDNFW